VNAAELAAAVALGIAILSGLVALLTLLLARSAKQEEVALRAALQKGDAISLRLSNQSSIPQEVRLVAFRDVPAGVVDDAVNLVLGSAVSLRRNKALLQDVPSPRQRIAREIEKLSSGALGVVWAEAPSQGEQTPPSP